MQNEVEGDLSERRIQAACTHFRWVGGAAHFRDQTVARGEGEVVVQVFVSTDVDLRRQLPKTRCGDEATTTGKRSASSRFRALGAPIVSRGARQLPLITRGIGRRRETRHSVLQRFPHRLSSGGVRSQDAVHRNNRTPCRGWQDRGRGRSRRWCYRAPAAWHFESRLTRMSRAGDRPWPDFQR
jgi:hypothetical protein